MIEFSCDNFETFPSELQKAILKMVELAHCAVAKTKGKYPLTTRND